MNEQTEKPEWRNRLVPIAVLLVFLAPLLIAWYVAKSGPARGGGEHGIMINPPRALEDLDLIDPVTGEKTPLYGKWTMISLIEGDCDRDCIDALYRMRQIRLAMGRRALRVQRAVFLGGAGVEENTKNIFSGYEGQLILHRDKAGEDFRKNFLIDGKYPDHAIYLIDTRGFLMMCYPKNSNPSGMIKDLERLLKTTG